MPSEKKSLVYPIAISLALLIVGLAAIYKFTMEAPQAARPTIELGKAGSSHAHVSMLIFIGEDAVNFCEQRFMLKSQFVHFEDNNCRVIHKHATGATLPIFFKTIGVELGETCITLPFSAKQYCNDETNQLSVVVNGKERFAHTT